MRVGWNEKTIGWMRSASEWTGFHRELAGLVRPHVALGGTLCDLGCGLGFIDLELAPDLERVTCLDNSAPALEALARFAGERGLDNLEPRLGDVERLEGEWDTVLSVFFGFGDRMSRWLTHCRRSLIVVMSDGGAPAFGPSHPVKRNTAQRAKAELEEAGLRYHVAYHALEYGQPFRTREEAGDFVRLYGRGDPARERSYLQDRLTATGRADYPWYLPQQKRIAVFTLRREENPL